MRNPFRRSSSRAETARSLSTPDRAPSREMGYVTTGAGSAANWWQELVDEHVPELGWPQAFDVYDQMLRNSQVNSVQRAVLMPILRTGWRIDGTGCDPQITRHVSRDLNLPIVGQGDDDDDTDVDERFDFGEHLEVAGDDYLGYGHAVFEQKAYLGEDGLWHLAKLGYRPPRTIQEFKTARDGGLTGVVQGGDGLTGKPVTLDVRRIVVYSRAKKGSNWRGRSLLRPGYQPYLINQRATRVEMILAERAGAPLTVYTAAPHETDLTKGEDIARRVRVGQTAGAAIANGATLRQQGIEGTLPDLDKIKRYNDEQIARTVLAHFLNLGQASGTGSYALGETLGDFFTLSIQATAADIARTVNRHVVRDLVGWNWPGARSPKVVFDEIGSRQNSILNSISILVNAGVLQPDESLEHFIRTTLGLPPRGTQTKEAS
jgi:hypothetical protein